MNYCPNCGTKVDGVFCSNCGTKIKEQTKEVAVKADIDSAGNATDKEVLLNTLYVLRAGMSHISIKADEAEKEKKKDKPVQEELSKKESNLKVLNEKYNQYKKICNTSESVDDYKLRLHKLQDEKERKEKPIKILVNTLLIFLIYSILYFPVVMTIMAAIDINLKDYTGKLFLFFSIGPVMCIVSFILLLCCKEDITLKKRIDDAANQYNAALKIETCKKYIDTTKNEIASLVKYNNNPKLNELLKESVKLYNSLVNAFGDTLNPQDWGNIDTIIYCLETNRADTLKEALHQTDLVIRHEEIKAVMVNMGNKICSTIAACTERLYWQMENISENQKHISAELKNINDNILSASEMQTALLEKANENSKKLMEDVNRMRTYADIEAAKKGTTL